MPSSTNVVVVSGHMTRDPELKQLPSGSSVCQIRLAVNDRVKRGDDWMDVAYYFDVTVWGKQGENIAKYLGKGSGIVVTGKLRWREWDAQDGSKRQAVDIEARDVQWMPKGDGGGERSGGGGGGSSSSATPPPSSASIGDDDDIPFAFLDTFDLDLL